MPPPLPRRGAAGFGGSAARCSAALAVVAAWSVPAAAQDIELDAHPTRWRAGVELVNTDGEGETLMLGLHYDLLELFDSVPDLYLGFGGFGAVAGEQGGLFAAGATAGWRRSVSDDWWMDLGAFVGGGGGDGGDWGGGLFLRPHLAVERSLGGRMALRVELSHMSNPGGGVDSTQLGIGLSRFDRIITARPSVFDLRPLPRNTLQPDPEGLTLGGLFLDPSSGSKRRDGSPLTRRILLGRAGVELPLDDGWFVPIEIAGAAAGGVDGYVQALTGIGVRRPWFPDQRRVLDWQARLLAGPAGGGSVDTGGGLLLAAEAGFEGHLARDWSMRLLGGYFVAPDGEFDGTSLSFGVRWAPSAATLPDDFDVARLASEGLFARDHVLDAWRVQLLHKSYFLPTNVVDDAGAPVRDDVHLVGAGAVKDLGRHLAVSLRGFSAWDGEVGGYHEGQVGLRYHLDVLRTIEAGDFYLQYHAGAGGGGGADVGSGLIHEFAAGWRYPVRPTFAFGLEVGKLEADRGSFEAQSLAATFSWSITRPLMN